MVSEPLPGATRARFPWRVAAHALVPALSFVGALAAVRGLLVSTGAAWMAWASTSVVNLLDLGPSCVVAAALMVGVVFGPAPGRLLCALGFAGVAPELFEGLGALDMTAIGHVCAIATGLVVAYLLNRARRVAR